MSAVQLNSKSSQSDTLDLLFNTNDGILAKEEFNELSVLDAVLPSDEGGMLPDIDLDALLNTSANGQKIDILEDILSSPKESSPSPEIEHFLDSPPYIQSNSASVAPAMHIVKQDHSYISSVAVCDLSFATTETDPIPLETASVESSPSHVDIPLYINDDLGGLETRQRSAPGPIRHNRRSRASSGSNSGLPYTIHDIHVTSGSPSSDSYGDDENSRSSAHGRCSDESLGQPGERLILTDEERILLAKEGLDLPDRLPLTREEERILRSVRRKIRNKISAKNSRLKKQEYVVGLEHRVKVCSKENRTLRGSVDSLKSQNRQLMTEVRRLRQWISCRFPEFGSVTAGGAAKAGLYTLFLSFALVLTPMLSPFWQAEDDAKVSTVIMSKPSVIPGRTRMLLQEREAAIELGDPYHITVRPAGPPWQNPPKTAAIDLPAARPPAKPKTRDASLPEQTITGNDTDDTIEEESDSDSRGTEL